MPPYLTANGLVVPCGTDAGERPGTELGERETGIVGNTLASHVAHVRRLRERTTPMPLPDAAAMEAWLLGRGDLWSFADLFSGRGRIADAGAVATLRPREGKFGQSIAVEAATTNLIPVGAQQFGGWAYLGAVVTLTQGQAIPGVTASGATRVQTSGGSSVAKLLISAGAGVAGAPASFSIAWIWNIGSKAVTLTGNGISGGGTVQPGEIARVTGSTAAMPAGVDRQIQIRAPSAADSLDFVAIGPMIEELPFASSFTAAPRAAGQLLLPSMATRASGTVATWFTPLQPGASIVGQTTSPAVLDFGSYFTPGSWRLWLTPSTAAGSPHLALYVRGGTNAGFSAAVVVMAGETGWYQAGVARHIAVTWSAGSAFTAYVNGAPVAAFTIPDPFPAATAEPRVRVGTADSSSAGNGLYSQLITAPYSMTPGMVAALHGRTSALAPLPLLTCSGDRLQGDSVQMLGSVEGFDPIAGRVARERVRFTLTEQRGTAW